MADSYNQIFDEVTSVIQKLPAKIAVLAVNFSKDRFVKKNWFDKTEKRWKASRKKKGSTMVASGRLKRSIRNISVNPSRVVVGSDAPYAQAHNDGLTIEGIEQVRGFTRKKHRRKSHIRKGKRIPVQIVNSYRVSSFSRKYKRKFAKRQFMGKSERLTRDIQELTTREINRVAQR